VAGRAATVFLRLLHARREPATALHLLELRARGHVL
jgi:hypothetical protein